MVTARSQLEDKMIGEETGVNEYITKPFELDAIVKKVEEYLGKAEGGGSEELNWYNQQK
jgi:DNA-binding response OmpR family regulator